MRVSIKKTVVAAIAALGMAAAVAIITTPAEAQFHGGGGFHGGGFHGGGGFRGGGWGGGWRGGGWVTGALVGVAAGAVVGAAAVGTAAGAGAAVGAGVGIRAGRSRRRPCPSGSRSLRSRPMATVRVAGSGGASGQVAATILAGGLSTFATDRPRAVSSDDTGPD
jgi:hypothetical protein